MLGGLEASEGVRGLKPEFWGTWTARLEQVAEKVAVDAKCDTGAEARIDRGRFTRPVRLRSGQAAEAPLFHVTARLHEFFRSLWKPCPSQTHL